jgi:hypothetical protein
LGWTSTSATALDAALAELQAISNALGAAEQAIQAVAAASSGGSGEAEIEQLAPAAIEAVQALAQAITDLAQVDPHSFAGLTPFDDPDFWAPPSGRGFPELLLDYVLTSYLGERFPTLFGVMTFAGLVSADPQQQSGAGRLPCIEQVVHWDRLPELVDPSKLFADVYGWGGEFAADSFLENLAALLGSFGVGAAIAPASSYADPYYPPGTPGRESLDELVATVFSAISDDGTDIADSGLSVHAIPIPPIDGMGDSSPSGVVLLPVIDAKLSTTLTFIDGVLTGKFTGDFASKLVSVEVRPAGAAVKVDGSTGATFAAEARIEIDATPATPWVLLGPAAGSHLELASAHAALVGRSTQGTPEFIVEAGADKLTLVINLGASDGFLQTVLGSQPQRVDLGFAVTWSSIHGFRFSGQTKIAVDLPVHLSVAGVISIDSIHIALNPAATPTPSSVALELSVTGGITLGPLSASVTRMGVELDVAQRADGKGTLGDLDLAFGFKPPDGLGVAIDADVVTGGGYIECHPDLNEYDGILQLELEGIGIGAIGLLNTVLPDGTKGFSLLLLLYAQFEDAPIQIGFGFELTGLGGLAGINRTMVEDALRTGVRNGAVSSILFPDDPVANGPKIISNLRSIFPPLEGHYVFGPMVEIAWGDPPLVTAELGVILELPAPLRIVILGRISTMLPDPDAPLIEINMDTAGGLDFGAKNAWASAHLYDSRVVKFALSGDMVFLWDWGDQPNFVLAAGGFDPRYTPPAGLGPVDRLALTIGDGDNPRLTIDGYFAVTSNTLQHGAQVSVYAADAGFAVQGSLGYDILIILSPLSFIADMQASVEFLHGSATLMSAQLQLTLSGPSPWHAHGSASIHILFINPSVNIDKQWGDSTQATLPATNAQTPFMAALGNPSNWIATPPSGSALPISLGGTPADSGTVLVHPLGEVSVRQKIVPLEVTLTRFGGSSVDGPNYFRIGALNVSGQAAAAVSAAYDEFALGQFIDLTDDEKLSDPSFEQQKSGATLGAGAAAVGHRSPLGVTYETFVVDDAGISNPQGTYHLDPGEMTAAGRWGAGANAPVLTSGGSKYLTPGTTSPISIGQLQHVIADVSTLVPRLDISGPSSFTGIEQALASHLGQHPEDRGQLQIVPAYEAAA